MQNCRVCTKKNLWQSTKKKKNNARVWKCRNCGNLQEEVPAQGLNISPKVLYLDIETALMKVYVYDLFVKGRRINPSMIAQNRFVVNWAAQWLGKSTIISQTVTPSEAVRRKDNRIMKILWGLLDEADYVVWHNGNSFDRKIVNWRFLKNGMVFPSEYKMLDTFKITRKYTRPESAGLEYLSLETGGKPKKGLTQEEWIEIVETGNPKLLRKADVYCRGDVREGVRYFNVLKSAIEANGEKLLR